MTTFIKYVFIFLLILTLPSYSQNESFEWAEDSVLSINQFRSPQSEISPDVKIISIYSGSSFDFSFQMSSFEFMFTKNFNSKVRTTFDPKIGVIVAPDSTIAERLARYGQYNFDLTELYARKLRKALHENKKMFSNTTFFNTFYEELKKEWTQRSSEVMKTTELGKNEVLLKKEQDKVSQEILEYKAYCLSCVPPKLQKKKKKK